jgi:Tol biopolymer transport system component
MPRFGMALCLAAGLIPCPLLSQGGPEQVLTLMWVGRDGAEEVVDPELVGFFRAPAISPDGRRIAVETAPDSAGRRQIWIYSLEDGSYFPLAVEGHNQRPFWHPDGTEVGFLSDRDGERSAYARRLDPNSGVRVLRGGQVNEALWTQDGQSLLFESGFEQQGNLYLAPPGSTGETTTVVEESFAVAAPDLSPDGRWLAYQSDETGQYEIYVRPFPGPGEPTRVSLGGGVTPVWSHDGTEIIYQPTDLSVWIAATVHLSPTFAVESRTEFASAAGYQVGVATTHFAVSHDGRRRIVALRIVPEGQ